MSDLGLPELPVSGESYLNSVKKVLSAGAMMSQCVVDGEAPAPPAGVQTGQAYIMLWNPEELWPDMPSSADTKQYIAFYAPVPNGTEDGTWMYFAPEHGWTCYDKSIKGKRIYTVDEEWVEHPAVPFIDVAGGTDWPTARKIHNMLVAVQRTHGISQGAPTGGGRAASVNVVALDPHTDVTSILYADIEVRALDATTT